MHGGSVAKFKLTDPEALKDHVARLVNDRMVAMTPEELAADLRERNPEAPEEEIWAVVEKVQAQKKAKMPSDAPLRANLQPPEQRPQPAWAPTSKTVEAEQREKERLAQASDPKKRGKLGFDF